MTVGQWAPRLLSASAEGASLVEVGRRWPLFIKTCALTPPCEPLLCLGRLHSTELPLPRPCDLGARTHVGGSRAVHVC